MTIEELRNSGLLEMFILGELSPEQLTDLESNLIKFPDLKQEIKEIERAFRAYAEANGVVPRLGLDTEIIKSITGKTSSAPPLKNNTPKNKNFLFPSILLASLLALSWILSMFLYNKNKVLQKEYDKYVIECDSIENRANNNFALFDQINDANNNIIKLEPTEKFPETILYFHNNETTKKNFVQILNLPQISANQAFQLWSLKDGVDPIPLNVFRDSSGQYVFEVEHVDDTNAYAITIEPLGGSLTPNLTDLIGVITV